MSAAALFLIGESRANLKGVSVNGHCVPGWGGVIPGGSSPPPDAEMLLLFNTFVEVCREIVKQRERIPSFAVLDLCTSTCDAPGRGCDARIRGVSM